MLSIFKYSIILLVACFSVAQETHTFTTEEVDNIFGHIRELEIRDSLKVKYITLLEEKAIEDSLLGVEYQLKIDNLQKQIDLQEERITEIKPQWYDNKWIWFTLGAVSTAYSVYLSSQLTN